MALTQQFQAGIIPSSTHSSNESSIPVVTSLTDITAPFVGQLVFSATDTRVYRCTVAAPATWVGFTGGPTWALRRAASFPLASTTFVPIQWDAGAADSPLPDADREGAFRVF